MQFLNICCVIYFMRNHIMPRNVHVDVHNTSFRNLIITILAVGKFVQAIFGMNYENILFHGNEANI